MNTGTQVIVNASAHKIPLPDGARKENGQFVKGHRASPATEFQPGEHWRPEKPYWDAGWLRWHYLFLGKSAADIADEYDVTPPAIIYWLRKHGIPRRTTTEVRALKHWGSSGEDNPMYGVRGEDHPGWKGGCTPERQACYHSEEWLSACTIVRKRDGYKCQRCGATEQIHIHHIASFAIEELRTEPDNLILLCQDCHYWVHGPCNTEHDFIIEWKGGCGNE